MGKYTAEELMKALDVYMQMPDEERLKYNLPDMKYIGHANIDNLMREIGRYKAEKYLEKKRMLDDEVYKLKQKYGADVLADTLRELIGLDSRREE
jgi:hypothetical protein